MDNEIKKIAYGPDENIFWEYAYKYEYDNKGNWVKRIKFGDKIPKYVIERKIEYFLNQ